MKAKYYSFYMRIRNALYKNKLILRIYSYFNSTRPKRRMAKKLADYGAAEIDELFHILYNSHYESFCEFGTLLGVIREHGFIPHDYDIDLGVMHSESFSWSELEKKLESHGIRLIEQYEYNGIITEQTYRLKSGLTVDFFLYWPTSDFTMTTYVYYKNHDMAYSSSQLRSVKALVYPMIEGIQWIDFLNKKVLVPSDPEKHLEAIYGRTWKVPDPNYKPDRIDNIMPDLGYKIMK